MAPKEQMKNKQSRYFRDWYNNLENTKLRQPDTNPFSFQGHIADDLQLCPYCLREKQADRERESL